MLNIIFVFSIYLLVFLSITFLDVGHGDSILLESKQATLVIDTGDARGGRCLKKTLQKKKKNIDFLFITHPHPDHFYGISRVTDLLINRTVFTNGDEYVDDKYYKIMNKLKKKGIELKKITKGDFFDFGCIRLEVLHPDREFLESSISLNDRSLVMMLKKGENRLLLAGDVTFGAQEYMLANIDHARLRCDILKFPHHCSKASFNPDFIKAVSPRVAIISTGPSAYDYPDEQSIKQLEKHVPVLLRTDKEGSITIMW